MTEYYAPGEQSLHPYEIKQALEIYQWKHLEPGLASSAMGYLVGKVGAAAEAVVPDALKSYVANSALIETSVAGALDLANAAARKMTDCRDVFKEAGVSSVEELRRLPLERSDVLADNVHDWAIAAAGVEGGLVGFAGLPGMFADIPALITLCFRSIHKIGLCYGYELEDECDAQTVHAILSSANAASMQEKIVAFHILGQFQKLLVKHSWTYLTKAAAVRQLSNEGGIIAIKTLLKAIGINLTKRKALQAIPLIGGLIGAVVNGYYVQDIGWAARRVFQERKLADQGKIVEIYSPNATAAKK
jgi:uncharacterized protein (DUF697 family)